MLFSKTKSACINIARRGTWPAASLKSQSRTYLCVLGDKGVALLGREESGPEVAHLLERRVVFGLPSCPCRRKEGSKMETGLAWGQSGTLPRGGETKEGTDLLLLCPWAARWLGLQLSSLCLLQRNLCTNPRVQPYIPLTAGATPLHRAGAVANVPSSVGTEAQHRH